MAVIDVHQLKILILIKHFIKRTLTCIYIYVKFLEKANKHLPDFFIDITRSWHVKRIASFFSSFFLEITYTRTFLSCFNFRRNYRIWYISYRCILAVIITITWQSFFPFFTYVYIFFKSFSQYLREDQFELFTNIYLMYERVSITCDITKFCDTIKNDKSIV